MSNDTYELEYAAAAAGEESIPSPDGHSNLIDTDYVIGQDNITYGFMGLKVDLHSQVFAWSALVILTFVTITLALPDTMGPMFNDIRSFLTNNLSWAFMLSTNAFVILAIGLIFSPLGKVRLGGTHASPDFSYLGWFAMLFAAGMGVGLMFYCVSEPLTYFDDLLAGTSGPLGQQLVNTESARSLSMATSIFHWGMHPWGTYAIVALALALFAFNKGLPLTMRSVFYPVLGERIWGWPGHVIDVLAVFATLFGLATSLGLGASQASAGLHYLFGFPNDNTTMVLLVLGITAVTLVSVIAGVEKGVRRISQLNMTLAFLLMMFVIVVGPTLLIATGVAGNLVSYLQNLPVLSVPFGREDEGFIHGWTAFYWAWWVSWSPFVGMFIARVSRGRTVREFLIAVLLVPTAVSVVWMSAFGETALDQLAQGYEGAKNAALELQLFSMLDQLPLASVTSLVGILLVMVFFITSSDSGSLVIDSITSGGKVSSPKTQRVFWVTIEAAIAIALLLGGGLTALQAAVLITGVPFMLVVLISGYSVVQGLRSEPRLS
ncbi:BCCT family transporter [Marinobacter oulmenensis]|uniref:BCCT family betaine/carnitine transporter n=1 Tax=Marinobacter oulmenensis TaxID=643747 RepID=A0A840UIL8_9GAMM|nr:BCCT family transporter [Marinobacter oulmenensis]MBB5320976.1 BCCT family betaine/carnitine transporter [Marinobacter oulmenensis]